MTTSPSRMTLRRMTLQQTTAACGALLSVSRMIILIYQITTEKMSRKNSAAMVRVSFLWDSCGSARIVRQ